VTDAGVDVALAVPATLLCAENAELVGGVGTYIPAHWDAPDSTVTEAHANVPFACCCGATTRSESPGLAVEPDTFGGVGLCRVPLDASRLSVLDVVE
jgi:hypothetical protein